MIEPSACFDRAADFYDATRGLPAVVQDQVIDGIVAGISRVGANDVLEVGIGTGRMARPLAERGVRVCGVDIAPRMLAKLTEQLGPSDVAPDLILGDVTRLPIASGSFSAALEAAVLHLVPTWQRAVEEMRRVITPGGVLIRYRLAGEWGLWTDSKAKWDQLLNSRGFSRRERPDQRQIHRKLRTSGGSCHVEAVAKSEDRRTVADVLKQTRDRIYSWTWEIPEDLFFDCLRDYEAWAKDLYGDVGHDIVDRVVHELEVWSFR